MTDQTKAPPRPLARAATVGEIEKPFEGDLFERRQLADQLIGLIERLPDGGAIAINAAWGDGKTWFGRHWRASLKANDCRTIYLDAFESDYVEDPFLLLAAEFTTLAESADPSVARSLGQKAAAVGRVLAPAMVKGAFSAAARLAVGVDVAGVIEKAAEIISDETGERVEQAIEHRLRELQQRTKTVTAFRDSLRELASADPSPIVVFVDELDRCNPAFAVRLLERAKHFFEVPGVVFILLLNRTQLEAAIRGVYGEAIDANQYLNKFLTMTLSLPKRRDLQWDSRSFALLHLRNVGGKLGLSSVSGFDEFAKSLATFAQLLEMSYRDMERAVAYYGLTQSGPMSAPIVAYLAGLRVAMPEVFYALAQGSAEGHNKANTIVTGLMCTAPEDWLLPLLSAAHESVVTGVPINDASRAANLVKFKEVFCKGTIDNPRRVFQVWTSRMDLQVE